MFAKCTMASVKCQLNCFCFTIWSNELVKKQLYVANMFNATQKQDIVRCPTSYYCQVESVERL